VQVIPSIDLDRGRSRVVFWPGASSGVGAPTDRPDRLAERVDELGARVVHVVDFDGAMTGATGNLEAV
jgi:phosphoribosylformimino-5-aminoimidazole carboxamide ribonucleotide (ProFAR) isomerase